MQNIRFFAFRKNHCVNNNFKTFTYRIKMKTLTDKLIKNAKMKMTEKFMEYANRNFLNNNDPIEKLSKKFGISTHVVTKLKSGQNITLSSIIKILKTTNDLNAESITPIMRILIEMFIPDISFEFFVIEQENHLPKTTQLNLSEIFTKLHNLSGKDQLEIAVFCDYSRSHIQNLMNNRGSHSYESINTIFWVYYLSSEKAVSIELVESYFNLLCIKMFGTDRFSVIIRDNQK